MIKLIRFIVTYYPPDGIIIEREPITDPVLEIVHIQYDAHQLDIIGDDYILVHSRKRLSECGYLGTFAATGDNEKPGYKVTLEINGTEYDYAYVHDHIAEIQIQLENAKLESLLGEF